MDDPDEQTKELDALYDHALAGMALEAAGGELNAYDVCTIVFKRQ